MSISGLALFSWFAEGDWIEKGVPVSPTGAGAGTIAEGVAKEVWFGQVNMSFQVAADADVVAACLDIFCQMAGACASEPTAALPTFPRQP